MIRLVHRTTHQLARAGGAGTGTAGLGQINPSLLGCVEDVGIVRALNPGSAFARDFVGRHGEKEAERVLATGGCKRCIDQH